MAAPAKWLVSFPASRFKATPPVLLRRRKRESIAPLSTAPAFDPDEFATDSAEILRTRPHSFREPIVPRNSGSPVGHVVRCGHQGLVASLPPAFIVRFSFVHSSLDKR